MPEPRQLRNPPITEAIIDLRAELGVGFDPVRLRQAEPLLAEAYLPAEEQHLFVRTISLIGNVGAPSKQDESALMGYRFRSRDERFVAQLSVEGLAVSQLRGYTRWEDLASEAVKLWNVYVRVASPSRILRAGTRYLNRVRLPLSANDFEEYFNTLPRIPDGVPQAASSFLVRMVLNDEATPYSVSITQYLEYANDGSPSMILDIDAFSKETYELDGGRMWEALAGLRELKNRVFFGSLTEKALDLFA